MAWLNENRKQPYQAILLPMDLDSGRAQLAYEKGDFTKMVALSLHIKGLKVESIKALRDFAEKILLSQV
jgi:hypothetical protein